MWFDAGMTTDATSGETGRATFPAYVEYTVRCNVETQDEFDSIREGISTVAKSWSTIRLHGDEAAVQVLYRKRPGVRPIASDPQHPPPFTFERATTSGGDDALV